MADLSKKCATKDFEQVAKLLPNLGLSDKSSNWLLEQRNLLRSQAPNEKEISSLIEDKVSLRIFELYLFKYRVSTIKNMPEQKKILQGPSNEQAHFWNLNILTANKNCKNITEIMTTTWHQLLS